MKKFNSLSDLSLLKDTFKTKVEKNVNKVTDIKKKECSVRYFIDPITKILVTERF